MAPKSARRDLPDAEALAAQLDALAAAMLDVAGDSRVATDEVRRMLGAVDAPVRQAAQVLHTHGKAMADVLAQRNPGGDDD